MTDRYDTEDAGHYVLTTSHYVCLGLVDLPANSDNERLAKTKPR